MFGSEVFGWWGRYYDVAVHRCIRSNVASPSRSVQRSVLLVCQQEIWQVFEYQRLQRRRKSLYFGLRGPRWPAVQIQQRNVENATVKMGSGKPCRLDSIQITISSGYSGSGGLQSQRKGETLGSQHRDRIFLDYESNESWHFRRARRGIWICKGQTWDKVWINSSRHLDS